MCGMCGRQKGSENRLKIMIQSRRVVIEQPRCVWAASDGKVETNNRRVPVLGIYESESRAVEVLAEIFDYQRRGKVNYIMPEK